MADLIMSFTRFAQSVPLGHPDHVMLRLVKLAHGHERGTKKEWEERVRALKQKRPAQHTLRLK